MKWDEVADQQCSVARASAVLGDRWTLIILSDCFLGVRRFDDFQRRLGISRTTLANRLKLLEAHGVLARGQYRESPPRIEYRLTDFYAPDHERTIRWDDPDLAIDWPLTAGTAPLVADKDAAGAFLRDADTYR